MGWMFWRKNKEEAVEPALIAGAAATSAIDQAWDEVEIEMLAEGTQVEGLEIREPAPELHVVPPKPPTRTRVVAPPPLAPEIGTMTTRRFFAKLSAPNIEPVNGMTDWRRLSAEQFFLRLSEPKLRRSAASCGDRVVDIESAFAGFAWD